LRDRIAGRFTLERVRHPITGEVLVDVNHEITDELADQIEAVGIESVHVRTVLTCEAKHGVCVNCYGRNLATNRRVEIGEAVGIIAAQSIGQPGTQLTMRTFHIGGAATKISEENRVYLRYPVLVEEVKGNTVVLKNGNLLFTRKGHITVRRILRSFDLEKGDRVVVQDGQRVLSGDHLITRKGEHLLAQEIAYVRRTKERLLLIAQSQRVDIRNGAELLARVGGVVPAEETIAYFDPFSEPIIAEQSGTVGFEDIILGTTLKEEINEDTGKIEKKITDFTLETLQPRLLIKSPGGKDVATYYLPGSAYLNVRDGEEVQAGRILAKLPRESVKTRDITGGLPRVGELFEARKPKNPTVPAKVAGTVSFKGILKGKRVIVVMDPYDKEFKHLVPMGKHLLVRDGDEVEAGELLCDGPIDPHDILHNLGENALQMYLLNEVQEVYRLQGVTINDKHVGVIIRQMMKKVEIMHVGDTNFIYGQQIDRYRFMEENRKVIREGGQPAIARPLLLGITKASLNIDSFFSAASFQETTRVLTNASISGSRDHLRGLKENVIIGRLIPAGTGIRQYQKITLLDENMEDLDVQVNRVIEEKKKEKELAAMLQEAEA
jgi:DNA-directed RNA polymerase subunit beta'